MNAFRRQTAPDFWSTKEQQWLDKLAQGTVPPSTDCLRWQHESRSLAEWMHTSIRPTGERRLCAYCDGILGVASRETIDHFIPEYAYPTLALTWENLYPACDTCNSTNKGKSWSCLLLRPDVDPVDEWITFDPVSGRLKPAPGIGRQAKKRVLLTIHVLNLNDQYRCEARLTVLQTVRETLKEPANMNFIADLERGPYRFVTRQYLKALTVR